MEEHRGNFQRFWGSTRLLEGVGVIMLQAVGDVAVLSQEREELQKEMAEVFADAKPPCATMYKGVRAEKFNAVFSYS